MKKSTKLTAVALSIFPGLGQILTGRYMRGFILFFSFLLFMDFALVIIPCLWSDYYVRDISRALVISSVLIWCYNIMDILRIVWWLERASLTEKKAPFFQKTIAYYLQNNFPEARKELKNILRLDRDDADALFYLGAIAHREGKYPAAIRFFHYCLQLDQTEKWRWEISQLIAGQGQ
ncbi:MAG: tetratricopeptide repeat protein [Planctomycetes bacterium]|nr:tetratricopeptide repeat protein [Planctomycetota bacterium]